MVQIKICGVRDVDTAGFCVEQGVDFLGLVFYPPSRRYVDPASARSIVRAFQGQIKFVGVFMDAPEEEVNRTAEEVGVDYIQLHGKESPAYCQRMRRPVIKAFGVGPTFSFRELEPYRQNVLYHLFDNPKWGSGCAFDWLRLKGSEGTKAALTKPFFLAGGLNPENVREAIRETGPAGVDVSSGVETNGRKDLEKVRKFVNAVRYPLSVAQYSL